MVLGIKPTVDVVFKTVFGSENHIAVTTSLINAILGHAGMRKARSVSIANPLRLGQFRDDKDAILDIRALDESDREFQLEIQVRAYPALPRRMLHNWASCYLSRLSKGQGYRELEPVVSIWILENDLFEEEGWFRSFSLTDLAAGIRLCDDESIFIIELAAWARTRGIRSVHDIEGELEKWLYFLWKGEELDAEDPPAELDSALLREAMESMAVFTKSEAARDLYRRRMEYRMERASIQAYDREVGKEEGKAEGDRNRALETARRLKALGISTDIIVQATDLSRDEVEALA